MSDKDDVLDLYGLNMQQKAFALNYMKTFNGTQSAIEAGYSPKTADSQASQLLRNPKIAKYIKEMEDEMTERLWKQFKLDAIKARRVMENIMLDDTATNRDRINAAKDLLDRGGYKPVEKQNIDAHSVVDGKIQIVFGDDDD